MTTEHKPHSEHFETVRKALWVDGQPELVYTSALASANQEALAALRSIEEQLDATRVALDRGAADYVGLLEQLQAADADGAMDRKNARAALTRAEGLQEQHQTARDALVKIAEGPSDTSPPEIARCALGWPAHGWESGIYEQLEVYLEFYAAWWEVEKGVIDFDLHPEAVTRLSEAHAAVIRLDSIPASGERVAAGLPSSTSETSGANQSPEDSSPASRRDTLDEETLDDLRRADEESDDDAVDYEELRHQRKSDPVLRCESEPMDRADGAFPKGEMGAA